MFVCLLASVSAVHRDLYSEFVNYMLQYGKHYSHDEFQYRYDIFKTNYEYIESHNQQDKSWKMRVNHWTDRTWEEFAAERVGWNSRGYVPPPKFIVPSFEDGASTPEDIPESWDWRQFSVVNPVKDQKQCGSCWAFSGISVIESAYAIQHKKLYNLSEQQLVDCSSRDSGCNGGLMDNVFTYATQTALCESTAYPYTAQDGQCHVCEGKVRVKDYVDIYSQNEEDILKALLKQPISVAIEADETQFQFYHHGVLDGECGTNLDHGVVLVGYGTENGKDYWIVRNSWGPHWGDEGYIKLRRGKNMCGIAMQASYPIV